MGTEQWDLNELADAAGVTPRTVRYYVQQGLLPAPAARGPGAHYERDHLDRLRLIKRLQRQHYPLAEIRRRPGVNSTVTRQRHDPSRRSRFGRMAAPAVTIGPAFATRVAG